MRATTDNDIQNSCKALTSNAFSAMIVDAGKVRLGGQGPVFRPASIADAGKVRLGGQGPVFR